MVADEIFPPQENQERDQQDQAAKADPEKPIRSAKTERK